MPSDKQIATKELPLADLFHSFSPFSILQLFVVIVVPIQCILKGMSSMSDKNQSESANAFSFHLVEHVDSTWRTRFESISEK